MPCSLGPREPIPCPHDDCYYRDGLVGGELGIWLRLNKHDAVAIVDAIERGHPHRATLILKRQPWYPSMATQLRQTMAFPKFEMSDGDVARKLQGIAGRFET